MKRFLLPLLIAFTLLAGCAPPPADIRYIYPLPPDQPRIEWLGTYMSQDDFPKSGWDIFLEKIIGKPPLDFFSGPYGIAADGAGRVFVVDLYQKNVLIYDLNARTIKTLLDEPLLNRPLFLSIDSKMQLYVADGESRKVLVFTTDGRLIRTYGNKDELVNPVYVKVDEPRRRLYISDTRGGGIHVYDLDDGRRLLVFGKGELLGAQGVAVGPDGNFYVADTLNAKIRVFDASGKLLRSFGERIDQDFGFEHPKDVAFDSEGHLWVLDYRKPMLRIFDTEGTFLFSAGGPATHKMGFANPTALYISPDDEVYVTDLTARRFSHWRYLSKAALARHPLPATAPDAVKKPGEGDK